MQNRNHVRQPRISATETNILGIYGKLLRKSDYYVGVPFQSFRMIWATKKCRYSGVYTPFERSL